MGKNCHIEFVNEKILPALSVDKGCCSHQITVSSRVSTEEIQDGKKMPTSSQTLPCTLTVHPEEAQERKQKILAPDC